MLIPQSATAQPWPGREPHLKLFREAQELFQDRHYAQAQDMYDRLFREHQGTLDPERLARARFNAAYCALELFNPDAESRFLAFIEEFPEHPLARSAWFQLGRFYFRQGDYKKSLVYLERTQPDQLNKEERAEWEYRTGFCYFQQGKYDEALPYFSRSKSYTGRFTYAAVYYYSWIHYQKGNAREALQGFQYLEQSKIYAPRVRVFIASLFISLKRYTEAVEYAEKYRLDTETQDGIELERLLGNAQFELGKWSESILAYNRFLDQVKFLPAEDRYRLGMAYAHTDRCDRAQPWLEGLVQEQGWWVQYALNTLGHCFLKDGLDEQARQAYGRAANAGKDPVIRENALFLFGRLSLKGGFYPEAVDATDKYLKEFAGLARADEVRADQGEALIRTRDYQRALTILRQIKNPGLRTLDLLQQVTYLRAVQIFDGGNPETISSLLTESMKLNRDPMYTHRSRFWLIELELRQKEYRTALNLIKNMPPSGAWPPDLPAGIYEYQKGYAYFGLKDYGPAAEAFEKFLPQSSSQSERLSDALIRAGDSRFALRNYKEAIAHYNRAAEMSGSQQDYAHYQWAMALGQLGQSDDKVQVLNNLYRNLPESPLRDDALYEIGATRLVQARYSEAIAAYEKLISEFPASHYVPQAYMGIGLSWYNNQDDAKAIAAYKKVLEDYRDSPWHQEALLAIKNVYMDNGDAQAYLDYVGTIPNAQVSLSSQDTLLWQSGFKRYSSSEWPQAVAALEGYLTRFSDGQFVLPAQYYLGESYLMNGDTAKALDRLEKLTLHPGVFQEKSLVLVARIAWGRKEYVRAQNMYTRLDSLTDSKELRTEARIGRARCAYHLQQYDQVPALVGKALEEPSLHPAVAHELRMYSGKSFQATGDTASAAREWRLLKNASTGEPGAEARYLLAQYYFDQKKYDLARDEVFGLSNQVPSHEQWVVRGYLLLAKTYRAQGDAFMAKVTLQSILDNYEGDEEWVREETREELRKLESR